MFTRSPSLFQRLVDSKNHINLLLKVPCARGPSLGPSVRPSMRPSMKISMSPSMRPLVRPSVRLSGVKLRIFQQIC